VRNDFCKAKLQILHRIVIRSSSHAVNSSYNSHPRQISYSFMMIWCELQQLMHTKCHKAGILALASCSKCMVRVWKVTN